MKHQVTIISDDFRFEIGRKITLVGIYDETIVFRQLPSRLLKLAFYQRWLDASGLERVSVEVRGSAIGDIALRAEGKSESPKRKEPRPARIMLIFGPLDFLREGNVEFVTFFNDDTNPQHTFELRITTDPSLKLEP